MPSNRRFAITAFTLLSGFATTTLASAQEREPEPPPAPKRWYEAFQLGAFVDGYGQYAWNNPKPQDSGNGIVKADGSGTTPIRGYDTTNGFALAWAGLELSHPAEPVGGTVSLRFGPATKAYAGFDTGTGLEYVKQAYATWSPYSILTLDFGKFDTIYGAEVADSHRNFNYSRGLVYWLAQPLFHTGFRATWKLSEVLSLRLMAVNGWNQSIDQNAGKSFGAQFVLTPSDDFSASLGWYGGPEQADSVRASCPADQSYDPAGGGCVASPGAPASSFLVDRGGANDVGAWRHFGDLVLSWTLSERFALLANGSIVTQKTRTDVAGQAAAATDRQTLWGASLGARYRLTPTWALAARGEYVSDSKDYAALGLRGTRLGSGTLTLEARPSDALVLRLEQRADVVLDSDGTKDVFQKDLRDRTSQAMTTTLGVVVTTN